MNIIFKRVTDNTKCYNMSWKMCPEKIDRSCAVGKPTPQRSTSVSTRPGAKI